jgi:hypothetical protein
MIEACEKLSDEASQRLARVKSNINEKHHVRCIDGDNYSSIHLSFSREDFTLKARLRAWGFHQNFILSSNPSQPILSTSSDFLHLHNQSQNPVKITPHHQFPVKKMRHIFPARLITSLQVASRTLSPTPLHSPTLKLTTRETATRQTKLRNPESP